MTLTAVRTEVEAVSDAVWALWRARVLNKTNMASALHTLGLTRFDIDNAEMRDRLGRARPTGYAPLLPTVAPEPDPTSPGDPAPRNPPSFAKTSSSKPVVKPVRDGPVRTPTVSPVEMDHEVDDPRPEPERFCRGHCELLKPESDFTSGSRVCRDCVNRERRRRYFSVDRQMEEATKVERATLRYIVSADDPGLACSRCGETLREGREVIARGIALEHAGGCARR